MQKLLASPLAPHFNSVSLSFYKKELTLYELNTTQYLLSISFPRYLVLTKVWLLILSPPGRLS